VGIFDRGIILDCHHLYHCFFTPYIEGNVMKPLRIDLKKVNEIFEQIVDKAVSIEGQYLDIWDVSCKGNARERKEYYRLNKFECVENYYHYECLDAWKNVQEMEDDVGSDSLYLDVIEIVTGKKLPYKEVQI
jgi:hypothetical protein